MGEERPFAVLVADDQPEVRTALRVLLRAEGFEVREAADPDEAEAAVRAFTFDVALVDLNFTRGATHGEEGIDLLERLAALDDTLPVVVMTAWGTVALAVEAMKRGARDFIQKPWEDERLLAMVRTQAELARALRRGRRLEEENRLLRGGTELPRVVAESPEMAHVLRVIRRAARSDANVLLLGESGVGKGLLARVLHGLSRRAERSFITVNLGAIPESLFEAEFFGHTRGAFTGASAARLGRFELADGGTLFLDEVETLTPAAQAKLLRVLETGEFEPVGSSQTRRVDVRVVAASNVDLRAEMAAGRFREDLLYRLNTVEVRIPPLRERPEDIPVLAQMFLERSARRHGRGGLRFAPRAMEALAGYPWPGNVRELEHVVERAVILAEGEEIRPRDLYLPRDAAGVPELGGVRAAERRLILDALARSGGSVAVAARRLGISRQALYRRMEKYGVRRP